MAKFKFKEGDIVKCFHCHEINGVIDSYNRSGTYKVRNKRGEIKILKTENLKLATPTEIAKWRMENVT